MCAPTTGARYSNVYGTRQVTVTRPVSSTSSSHASSRGPRVVAIAPSDPDRVYALIETGEHPFGDAAVHQYDTMQVEPAHYLQAMMDDVLLAGGKILVRDFKTPADLQSLPEAAVFNFEEMPKLVQQ